MTTETTTETTTTTTFADASAAILSRLRAVETAEQMWEQATDLSIRKIPCRECGGAGTVANGSLGDVCPECLGARAEDVAGQVPLEPPPALREFRAQLVDAHRQVFHWHLDPKGEMPTPALPPWSAIEELLEGAAKAQSALGDGWWKLLPMQRIVEDPSLDDLEPDLVPPARLYMMPGIDVTNVPTLHGDSEDAKVVLEAMGGSVLPVVFDDGSAIVCSRLAGGARSHHGVPNDLHLTIRRPGHEDQLVCYSRQIDYTDDYLTRLEKLYQSYGNQDTPDDWRALQRDVGELLRAVGWDVEVRTSKWRVAEMLAGCSPHRHVRWTIAGDVKQASADAHGRIVVTILDANANGNVAQWTDLEVADLTRFGTYVDDEVFIEVGP